MHSLELALTKENAIITDDVDVTIPAIVYEVLAQGREQRVAVLLNHNEPPIAIAGLHQDRMPHETRRPDGGFAYFHGNNTTNCFMRAQPHQGSILDTDAQKYFIGVLKGLLRERGYSPVEVGGDLDQDGRRLVSLSHNTHGVRGARVTMSRACWYTTTDIQDLRGVIEQSGHDFDRYKQRITALPRLRGQLAGIYGFKKTSVTDFVSDESVKKAVELQEKTYTRALSGACVLESETHK